MTAAPSEHRRIAGNAVRMLQRAQIAGSEAMLWIEVMNWLEHAVAMMEAQDGDGQNNNDHREDGPAGTGA